MSIQMDRKDYVAEGGSVASVSGGSALLSDILFRLSARRGGFVLLPEFGSRMHLLRHEKPSARAALARQYAVEALAEPQFPHNIAVAVQWVRLVPQLIRRHRMNLALEALLVLELQ